MWKGPITFARKKYTKRVPFLSKKVHKRKEVGIGAEPPGRITLVPARVPPRPTLTTSTVWASETSLARTCEQVFPRSAPPSRVLARLASLAQIGELARRLSQLHL